MDSQEFLEEAVAALQAELAGVQVDTQVLEGHPAGRCASWPTDLDAAAIVVGTRGRGGLKRAVLGSVSDHVVRHAACPVVVVNPSGAAAD